MKILSIDTSCDETAAAVTDGTKILSNIIWSQASAHAKFGGVMPSLAQRMHEERIDWVIKKALGTRHEALERIDAIAVTIGPGLSIALGVGIDRAKKLATKYNKKLIAINHLEAHILSPLVNHEYLVSNIKYPALGLVVSGGNTLLVKINKIGSYETLAETSDDALGEALDKAARMLGLGYPGGAILEKMARLANPKLTTRGGPYTLPIPIVGQEERKIFTYSGLKTAMMRLVDKQSLPLRGSEKRIGGDLSSGVAISGLSKEQIYNLSASFQDVAFTHLIRVLRFILTNDYSLMANNLFVGGGVSANIELRKRLRKLGKEFGISVHFPYSKKLTGDNAAMVGIAASFKYDRGEFTEADKIDRSPNLKI